MSEESDDEEQEVVRRHQMSWASDGKYNFMHFNANGVYSQTLMSAVFTSADCISLSGMCLTT